MGCRLRCGEVGSASLCLFSPSLINDLLIDSTRRGHVTSRNGEILPVFALAALKPAQKEQGAFN